VKHWSFEQLCCGPMHVPETLGLAAAGWLPLRQCTDDASGSGLPRPVVVPQCGSQTYPIAENCDPFCCETPVSSAKRLPQDPIEAVSVFATLASATAVAPHHSPSPAHHPKAPWKPLLPFEDFLTFVEASCACKPEDTHHHAWYPHPQHSHLPGSVQQRTRQDHAIVGRLCLFFLLALAMHKKHLEATVPDAMQMDRQ